MTREEREELQADHFEHGDGGYNNHDCRGPICRSAHAEAIAVKRAERRAHVAKHGLPGHVRHGASAYTNWGCKCAVCRAGHAAEKAGARVTG